MSRATKLTAAAAAAALVIAPAALAHVTLNPNKVPSNSFSRFAIRVPTERPTAATVAVTVQIPEGLGFVSFQTKAGWTRTVEMEKLDAPVTNDEGETVTERIASVTWEGGRIEPGEFDEFGLSARVPDEAGLELVFPSLQTYSNGEVVRWIGPPDADEPAPRVMLEAAAGEEEHGGATTPTETEPTETTAPPATDEGSDEDEDGEGRANLALGFGIAGLLAGLGGLGFGLFGRRA